jgi:Tol biopolymer transport system component
MSASIRVSANMSVMRRVTDSALLRKLHYQSPDGIFINLMRLPGAKAGRIAFPVLTSTLQGIIICSGG